VTFWILSIQHYKKKLHWRQPSQASKKFSKGRKGAFGYQCDCDGDMLFIWWNDNGTTDTVSSLAIGSGWDRGLKQKVGL